MLPSIRVTPIRYQHISRLYCGTTKYINYCKIPLKEPLLGKASPPTPQALQPRPIGCDILPATVVVQQCKIQEVECKKTYVDTYISREKNNTGVWTLRVQCEYHHSLLAFEFHSL